MPGDGGWITSENAHEFEGRLGDEGGVEVDREQGEDGEGRSELGPGAGRRRARNEEGEGEKTNGVNGDREEETKWQRTG